MFSRCRGAAGALRCGADWYDGDRGVKYRGGWRGCCGERCGGVLGCCAEHRGGGLGCGVELFDAGGPCKRRIACEASQELPSGPLERIREVSLYCVHVYLQTVVWDLATCGFAIGNICIPRGCMSDPNVGNVFTVRLACERMVNHRA